MKNGCKGKNDVHLAIQSFSFEFQQLNTTYLPTYPFDHVASSFLVSSNRVAVF